MAVGFSVRVKVMVQLTKHKRHINIVAMCPITCDLNESHSKLKYMFEFIRSELLQKSRGTNLEFRYTKALQRYQHDLDKVWSFSRENDFHTRRKKLKRFETQLEKGLLT